MNEYFVDSLESELESEVIRSLSAIHIILGVIFCGVIAIAYLASKNGKALIGKMKKAVCIVLCLITMVGVYQTAYAVPQYGFGRRDTGNTIHFDTRPPEGESVSNTIHFHPSSQGASGPGSGVEIHFDPHVTSASGARDSLIQHFHPGYNQHGVNASYIYGEIIGRLTVERLNRSMNVIGGATMSAMDYGAAHFSFSGLNHGNTALIGHNRGRTNGFFNFVRELREGDVITLEAGGITRSYAVEMLFIINDTDFTLLAQFGDNRLTLITCVEYRQHERRVAVLFEVQ